MNNRYQYLIRFGYKGSCFHGVQFQRGLKTVSGALSEKLEQAAHQKPHALQIAARTDAGVSAKSNLATCWFSEPFNRQEFKNNLLKTKDAELNLVEILETPIHVHARGSSRGKHYHYVVIDNSPPEQIYERDSWHIAPILSLKAMQEGIEFIKGQHDFSSFRASGCTSKNTVKTIFHCEIKVQRINQLQNCYKIDIFGDAFLRRMIRILIGTLVEIGTGLRMPHEMKLILASKNRQNAGITAPAYGLTLVKVGCEWPPDKSGLIYL